MEYRRMETAQPPVWGMERPTIFFDWDGTLADSMTLCIEECRQALKAAGLPDQDNASLARCNGPTYEESVAVLGLPKEKGEAFLTARRELELMLVPSCQKLFGGIREMLAALHPLADLVVVSNGLPEYLSLSAKITGVAECFTRIQPMIPGKTKTEALAQLLAELHPRRAVMVGDRTGDMLAGRANGLPTVAACYGYGLPNEWAEADQQAYSVAQLETLLRAWIAG